MPRIFAPKEDYNATQGYVDFVNGAAALPSTATAGIAYFTDEGFTVDTSKNALTAMDELTREQIDGISSYLGVALDPADTKAQVIRKIETAVSTLKIGTLTVTTTDTEVLGESVIAVTNPAKGATNIYKYKAAAAASPLLYGDTPDSTWKTFASGDTLAGLSTGHHCSVVECNAAGTFVYNYGDVVIDATPGD
jgi:hypothetical protein